MESRSTRLVFDMEETESDEEVDRVAFWSRPVGGIVRRALEESVRRWLLMLVARSIVADPARCRGCQACELACALAHSEEPNPRAARIRVFQDLGRHEPVVCLQCKAPPCVAACPNNAIVHDPELGIHKVIEDRCDACGACVAACPYHAIFVHPSTSQPLICDLCGGDPECVKACPFEALAMVETAVGSGEVQR